MAAVLLQAQLGFLVALSRLEVVLTRPNVRLRGILAISVSGAAAIACGSAPFVSELTTSEPKLGEVLGTYSLSYQSVGALAPELENMLAALPAPPSIVVNSDGTCEYVSIPDFGYSPVTHQNTFVGFVTTAGACRISIVGGVQNTLRTIDHVWGLEMANVSSAEIGSVSLLGEEAPFRLVFTIGDPDSGRVMIFSRE